MIIYFNLIIVNFLPQQKRGLDSPLFNSVRLVSFVTLVKMELNYNQGL